MLRLTRGRLLVRVGRFGYDQLSQRLDERKGNPNLSLDLDTITNTDGAAKVPHLRPTLPKHGMRLVLCEDARNI
jgi:hypothetical protein